MIPKRTSSGGGGINGLSKNSSVGRSGIQYQDKDNTEINKIWVEDSEVVAIVQLVLKNFII